MKHMDNMETIEGNAECVECSFSHPPSLLTTETKISSLKGLRHLATFWKRLKVFMPAESLEGYGDSIHYVYLLQIPKPSTLALATGYTCIVEKCRPSDRP